MTPTAHTDATLRIPPHVTTRIERARPEQIERIGRYTAATIHEAQGRRGAVASNITPIDRESSFVGSAFTVVCAPRDNLMLQVAIHFAQPGDVLIVSAGAFAQAGTFGDVLGNACAAKGIAALVTDSGVRDTRELRELGLPVFSGSVSISGTVKETLGHINQPLVFGGQRIEPGDIVKGDADGIVVVRRDEADIVAELSEERDRKEADLIARYHAGGTTIDLCGLHDVLRAKGLTTDLDDVDPEQGLGAR
ncbi:4-carboxy-4-hydroxy-2-oxoadipate aldolase/oxaloacetate decarboxylase [Pseudoclavibacter chungangensis]|uniref:Putative 4-hydroxy-4-methyl-2-oxoglutarate aldolase n=1 Tax=Pseudoclavibacter chungangensis TaxID=587635 RepID=A0A7J5BRG0_9MICO|nr:4-carboxy-4-hydroxy-2-oxoadipate aldolase/oxaloacetate decarboxylase [Pseudoclavibacter chungangensis]KAB1656325.1 4-carboxy-4-hydroxy-2-oxoadipate aldolase/oxaloacetate decarboxylase [Pseudoclavibacter chungangensis]NYJ67092.1 4-hydroxy-4-methyl-2-oxoglutarate aldolase [Pseudoclavibacter chungangensis]